MNEIIHSKEFIDKWKEFLINIYGYDTYMDFIIVPSIFGKKTLSYLPFIDYTDRVHTNIEDLLEISKDNNFLIKCLNFDYQDFKHNDTVDMRVDISSQDLDYITKNILHSRKCRNQIKKSFKSDLRLKVSTSIRTIKDFYSLYATNLRHHGTPMFSLEFFILLSEHFKCDFLVVYHNNIPISSVVILYDQNISLPMWAGINSKYFQYCPNHYMYYKAIDIAIQKNKTIFDFGRSPYEGATYKFKKQWGAKPIKIDFISSNTKNLYSKYSLATKIWKKTPNSIVNYVGPRLCKYLVDL